MIIQSKYKFVRVTVKHGDVEVIVGVDIGTETKPIADQYWEIRAIVEDRLSVDPLTTAETEWWKDPDDDIAARVETILRAAWPGRSYFIEVGRGTLNEWVQVYQPKEMVE